MRFIHQHKPSMSNDEHIKEGFIDYLDGMAEYYVPCIYCKDYYEYEPYLTMNEEDFFNKEHNSNYKLKEAV